MTTHATIRSWSAMLVGLIMTAVTGYVLFEDVLHGSPVTTQHVTSAATLLATIAAGHMIWPTLAAGRVFPALGLAVVFIAGTSYVVTMSGARNAETAAAKVTAASSLHADRARIAKLRDQAEAMLDEATRKVAADCRGGDGKLCKGTKATVAVYEAAVKGHEADLAKLAPDKPANGYAHAARVFAAMPGVTVKAEEIEGRLVLLMPYALVLVVEVATLTFLSLALGHREHPAAPAKAGIAKVAGQQTTPPKGKGRRGATTRDPKVITFVSAHRKRHGRDPSIPTMQAAFPGMATSTAQRYRHGNATPLAILRVAATR